MRDAGATLAAIAGALNAEGSATARAGKWWPATVRYILDNPKYRGESEYLFRWNGDERHVVLLGTHKALIRRGGCLAAPEPKRSSRS